MTSRVRLSAIISSIRGRENEGSLISLIVPINPLCWPPIKTTRLLVFNSIIFSTFCDGNSKTELNWGSLVQCINDIKASTNLQEGKLIAKKLKKDRLEAVELYLSKS